MTGLFSIIFFVLSAGISVANGQTLLPLPELETLPNGLKVAWFVDNRLPIVDLSLIVQAGSHEDPLNKSGTAELLAASLERGAGGMTASQIARAIDFLGGVHYSRADDDSVLVGMHGLAIDAAELLGILGKLILEPEFSKTQVNLERDRLVDRWDRQKDYSAALIATAYQRSISAGTLYGRGGMASIRELKSLTREDIDRFYRKYFTPENSILVIIGRVNPSEFRSKIAAVFNSWRKTGQPENEIPLEAFGGKKSGVTRKFLTHQARLTRTSNAGPSVPANAMRGGLLPAAVNSVVLVDRPMLTQAQIRMGFRVPTVRAPEHYPLVVANALLGGYFGSRLNREMRDRLVLTYGITSAITYNKEFAEFTISTATKNEGVGPLIRNVTELLTKLKTEALPVDEVENAKSFLEGGFPLLTSTLDAVASRWLTGCIFGLGSDFLNDFIPKIRKVTNTEVQKAIQKDFNLKTMVVLVAGDLKEVKKSLILSKIKF